MITKLNIQNKLKQNILCLQDFPKINIKSINYSKKPQSLNCRGVTRSDFKFHKNKFYLLEINTQPGMPTCL